MIFHDQNFGALYLPLLEFKQRFVGDIQGH